jgi:hypothetical protein
MVFSVRANQEVISGKIYWALLSYEEVALLRDVKRFSLE